ncbi:MAG: right-handed parallel beta-helix repeat-containing protein [Thermoanaerobaculia bacterium]
MRSLYTALAIAVLGNVSPLLAANTLVRVPQDSATLDAAIQTVSNGGAIELAAGTYATPASGFSIKNANAHKSFVIRAAAGAAVALDGGGGRSLVRIVQNAGQSVVFENITFQNGFTSDLSAAGGVTLTRAHAEFHNCAFLNNRSALPATGGGAVGLLDSSSATFVNSAFHDNSAPNWGGAIVVRSSSVGVVQGGELLRNRTNLPGHQPNSAGGAIYVLDATLNVFGARFANNEAGFVGGAIYAIGTWNAGANVQIGNSTFQANQAVADPCCGTSSPTAGGAIHAEDLTSLVVQQSLLVLNRADLGGAVDDYRAVVEIDGSVLRGNQSTQARPAGQSGGAISALSADFPDSSTAGGTINRRPARLVINGSLIQGGSEVQTPAASGACLLANGDTARQYGGTGVPLDGSPADNRAQVVIHGTAFAECNAATTGGAIEGNLVDLDLEDSMVLNSNVTAQGSRGGGVDLIQDSTARILRTTFAGDSAVFAGGALANVGSNMTVTGSRFYNNRVASGSSSQVPASHGASIFTTPDTTLVRDVTGTVSGSTFSGDQGLNLFDIGNTSGPQDRVLYDGNRFNPVAFGSLVYADGVRMPGGATVSQLNSLMQLRGGIASPNTQIFNPHEGALLVVPSPNAVGANPPAPANAVLAYGWTGSSATIGGVGLPQHGGLLEVGAGFYTLIVDGIAVTGATVTGTCTAGPVLCVAGNRFRAQVTWKAGNLGGAAQAVSLSADTGYFWFTDPANVELMVKVLDGRTLNGSFWVFYGALSNLEYTLTITDTVTGKMKIYTNPSGQFASVGDTTAFPAPANGAAVAPEAPDVAGELIDLGDPGDAGDLAVTAAATACAAGPTALCLSASRFRVQLAWNDGRGHTGSGQAVALSADTGYFWFTSANNIEVIIKVLDARTFNNHFWVFYGALSNLEYTLTVTDTQTGSVKTYHNPQGHFGSVGDTSAIPGP